MKKVDYIYQTVKNPHFVKNPGESAGFFKKTQKNPPGPGFFKILAGFANPAPNTIPGVQKAPSAFKKPPQDKTQTGFQKPKKPPQIFFFAFYTKNLYKTITRCVEP